jgi:hypothetical protein
MFVPSQQWLIAPIRHLRAREEPQGWTVRMNAGLGAYATISRASRSIRFW